MTHEAWPGRPFPLGPTWDGEGTNFSLFSEHAERVELCLFDASGAEERLDVNDVTAHCWHCYVPGVGPGQRYGYRVHGPYEPDEGHRFNAYKLLIDPYAKAIEGRVHWERANVLPYTPDGTDEADLEPDDEDSRDAIPKSLVVDPSFDWGGDRHPRTPWNRTLIYETHVRGFTVRHPDGGFRRLLVTDDGRGVIAADGAEKAVLSIIGDDRIEVALAGHRYRLPATVKRD
ncbi:MAG: hypothetical protein KY463_16165 [Actinobacteria bacterium]|nr:hypothetical protein [Actinomycetota bacterium]